MKNNSNFKNLLLVVMLLSISFSAFAQFPFYGNAFIGEVGHGSNWAGFVHVKQRGTNKYALLQDQSGKYTLLNKKNTGNGHIGFRIGNVDKMVLTNSGRFGIGTSNPTEMFHVTGSSYLRGHMYLYANEGDGSSGTAYIQARDKSNNSNISLQFRTQRNGISKDALKINSLGNIGIGTTSPFGELQFANSIKNRKLVLWQDGNNDHSFYGFGINDSTLRYQSSYNHVFYSNVDNSSSKEVFRINNDGKIVIGQSQLSSITNGASTVLNVTGGVTTGKVATDFVETENVTIGQSQLSSSTDAANTMLTVTGGVKTDKVVLNIGSFPDYVFANDYQLMPIEEVAKYVAENKHLPNIPSEKEMVATGLDVTAISVKLVEKIEELTLYTIAQQELINKLVERLEILENK